MDLFTKLFGDLLVFVYHCFDRIVIHGYLSGLSQPAQVVHFFRQVVGVPAVSVYLIPSRNVILAQTSRPVQPAFMQSIRYRDCEESISARRDLDREIEARRGEWWLIEEGFDNIAEVDPEIRGIIARNWPYQLEKLSPED